MEIATNTPYNEYPYAARAIPLTHPAHLALHARLNGLSPAPPENCRLLELGCAEAANIAAMAFHLDGGRFVGVDEARNQIEAGREARDRLGIDNLDLVASDILDLGPDLGEFDYIVCHGVLSWVPEPVQRRIFHICNRHLAPNGVAYISYNCGPGWALKGQLRRALLQRTAGAATPKEKIARIRDLLHFLADSPLKETVYGQLLARHAADILEHRDPYVIHEYLAPENRAFYFREITRLAEDHDLRFLAEMLRAVSDPTIESQVNDGLAARFPDPGEAEELADLMLFRAFRASLFCRAEDRPAAPDTDAWAQSAANDAFFAGALTPAAKRLSLEPDINETFNTPDGVQVSAAHPALKAALMEIGQRWPRGLNLDALAGRVRETLEARRLREPGRPLAEPEREALRNDLIELYRLGYLEMRLREPDIPVEPPLRPNVSALTRLEAARGGPVTNAYHQVVSLDDFTRCLAGHLDGTRDAAALAERMMAHYRAGDFNASDESGDPVSGENLEEALPALVREAVAGLGRNALLR